MIRPLDMSTRTRLIFLFSTASVVAFILVGGFLGRAVAREDAYRHLRIFEDVVSLIAENYVEDTNLGEVMTGALRGLTAGLDTDSTYLSPESVTRIERGMTPQEGAIGVEVTSQYYTQIISIRDGSPAHRAGLRPGDYIRAINDAPTRRLSAVDSLHRLRGEPGSTVRLSLLRGNTSEPYDIELMRELLDGPEVTSRMISSDIGYLRVAHFSSGVSEQIQQTVTQLEDQGATQLMIDVRSNGGGSFDEGIATARLFVASGPLLRRAETENKQVTIEATGGNFIIDTPVIVLSDYGTAHGAELFTASLVGSGRAASVGQRTAGRVSLQKLIKLPNGGGLWLSWARYLQASGAPLHRSGIDPTVAVDVPLFELGEPEPPGDPILERALEYLRTKAEAAEDRRVAQLVRAPA